jgi:SAM-dependent methyltransferase
MAPFSCRGQEEKQSKNAAPGWMQGCRETIKEQFMLDWNDRTVKWYADAVSETGFFQDLVQSALAYMSSEDHVIDLGCGLGYLTTGVADKVRRVTAVDRSSAAIQYLQDRCLTDKLFNVRATCADADHWQPARPCDVLMMSFYGDFENALERYIGFTLRTIVVILHWDGRGYSFEIENYLPRGNPADAPRKRNRACVEYTLPVLRRMGIPYTLKKLQKEFGQPFDSREDAGDFLRFHYPQMEEDAIRRFLRDKLQTRGERFYLPNRKNIGLLAIHLSSQ